MPATIGWCLLCLKEAHLAALSQGESCGPTRRCGESARVVQLSAGLFVRAVRLLLWVTVTVVLVTWAPSVLIGSAIGGRLLLRLGRALLLLRLGPALLLLLQVL